MDAARCVYGWIKGNGTDWISSCDSNKDSAVIFSPRIPCSLLNQIEMMKAVGKRGGGVDRGACKAGFLSVLLAIETKRLQKGWKLTNK